MNRTNASVPLKAPRYGVELLFEHDYGGGGQPFDYLHMVRSRALLVRGDSSRLEKDYWDNLEPRRRRFAAEVKALAGDVDLVIDPPSRNTLHRPYLAAVLDAYPEAPWLYFLKNQDVQALHDNLEAMRGAFAGPREGDRPMRKKKAELSRVLIVDDVFSEGNVAAVVIEKLLAAGVPPEARFLLACPLRVHG
jgi:hypothetical protein